MLVDGVGGSAVLQSQGRVLSGALGVRVRMAKRTNKKGAHGEADCQVTILALLRISYE